MRKVFLPNCGENAVDMNVLKRALCFFFALIMLLSIASCKSTEDGTGSSQLESTDSSADYESSVFESSDLELSFSEGESAVSSTDAMDGSGESLGQDTSSSGAESSADSSVVEESEEESSEDPSGEVSEENTSETESSQTPSAVEESEVFDGKESKDEPNSSVDSSETSQNSSVNSTEEYPVYSPEVDYKITYKNNGLILYNTDFRMSDSLEKEFNKLFSSFPYAQSICLTELSTNMAFAYKPDKRIATASSIKGPFGLYVAKSVDAGRLGWKDPKAYEPKHYQANSSGGIQHYDYGTSFSVKRLLELMIEISDNQAYLMLKDMLGSKKFNGMMAKLGADTIIPSGGNWGNITGWEMLQTWREIYYYKDVNKNGDMLFDLYLEAEYNYIQEALPQYTSAHKSGWSGKAFNDAGIVYNDNVYALSILLGRKDVYDSGSRVYFIKVAKLLDKLMKEYNAYLSGDSAGEESGVSGSESSETSDVSSESSEIAEEPVQESSVEVSFESSVVSSESEEVNAEESIEETSASGESSLENEKPDSTETDF